MHRKVFPLSCGRMTWEYGLSEWMLWVLQSKCKGLPAILCFSSAVKTGCMLECKAEIRNEEILLEFCSSGTKS